MKTEAYCGIVILNYNTPEDTLSCLSSIYKYNSAAVKIIIVDNASTDQSISVICEGSSKLGKKITILDEGIQQSCLPNLTLVKSHINGGYAQGNNLGINLLKQDDSVDSILILNSDILFVEDIIPNLRKTLIDKKAAIVSPILYKKGLKGVDYNCARKKPTFFELFLHFLMSAHEPSKFREQRYILKENPKERFIHVGLPSGSCMLFTKELCNTIGIFDPHTFLYYEENIIASKIQAQKLGPIIVDTELKCIHLGAVSTKKTPSRKIVKSEVDSARYFVNNYSNVSTCQKKAFNLTTHIYLFLDTIKRFVKK